MKEFSEKNDYFNNVYKIVAKIPKGKVTTYGLIAETLGNKKKSRIVGYALNAVVDTKLPCHRVVNRNGELSGSIHFPTPTLMRELLEKEGIKFIDNKVPLEKYLWKPKAKS